MIAFTKVALPYGWLGNMSPHPVVYVDLLWRTTEHLFQALRFPEDSQVREAIRMCASPMGAKMIAKKYAAGMVVAPRSAADLDNMRRCLRVKVDQHHVLLALLLSTDDEQLVEDASKRPNASGMFWGMCRQEDGTWKGENVLGNLWMALRTALRDNGAPCEP